MIRQYLAAFGSVLVAGAANAEPLTPAKADLAHLLSSMTTLADYTADPLVRVILLADSGECEEGQEARTCPSLSYWLLRTLRAHNRRVLGTGSDVRFASKERALR